MKIYAISDMHGQLEGLDPKGMDLVLIAGDFARLERLDFIGVCNQVDWVQRKFCAWCANYPQTKFCLIPGNHDIFLRFHGVLTFCLRTHRRRSSIRSLMFQLTPIRLTSAARN